jgi:hypothetical protein
MKQFCLLIAVASISVAATAHAQVTGTATLLGDAPKPVEIDMTGMADCMSLHTDPIYEPTLIVSEKKEIKNVVITIKPVSDTPLPKSDIPKSPAVLDQKGCQYEPHIRVGQPIEVHNDDPLMHNVHSKAETNPDFNLIQASKGAVDKIPALTAIETFAVKCDVHPWMSAWVIVTDNAFVAVTDDHGAFTLPAGLPDGGYTVHAWHEKLGDMDAKVTVKDGKGSVSFAFKAS